MIYVLLADGFEEIEALAFTDILRRSQIDVMTVSVNGETKVTGSHGITVLADTVISDVDKSILMGVVLPGGMPGTLNLQSSNETADLIKFAYDNKKYLGAICAAPMILGEMGLLNGKRATCYPGFEKHLAGAITTSEKVVCDGLFITSKGAGTASNFAHCFITELKGKKIADEVIESMQY